MQFLRAHLWALWLVGGWVVAGAVHAGTGEEAQARQGEVYFLRHALAPGFGDPPELTIGDCSTQRNLSAEGRAQARAIGDRLREEGITDPVLYSSQWCRCLDTAVLLGFGEPIETYGLNSFFQRRDEREGNLEELQRILDSLPTDGPPVIFVTHQVVVSAMTGRGVSSGEGRWVTVASLQE
jgi:phosphohistidine phosphatase SixA